MWCLCAQSTVFEWKVLGRPVTLMLIEGVVVFALVLALQRMSADSDPWRTLAKLAHRHWKAALAKFRCDLFPPRFLITSGVLRDSVWHHETHKLRGVLTTDVMPSETGRVTTTSNVSDGLDACRSLTGIGGRASADHQQLPSSDLEMIGGVAAAGNGHAPGSKEAGVDEPATVPAAHSLEDEDADLIVGAEILGPDAASSGMRLLRVYSFLYADAGSMRDKSRLALWPLRQRFVQYDPTRLRCKPYVR